MAQIVPSIRKPLQRVINGNDTGNFLTGTAQDDVISAGAGNDTVLAGSGNDQVRGGRGDDNLTGDDGRDRVSGDDGRDTVAGGSGDDVLFGGAGSDGLDGDGGSDRLEGGEGDDRVNGGTGSDVLLGGDGADTIFGATPDDRLDGDGDQILGGLGQDGLFGTAGADRITGGPGNDYMEGGPGADTYVFSPGDSPLLRAVQPEVLQDRTDDLSAPERDRLLIQGKGRPGNGVYFDGLGGNLNVFYGRNDRILVPNAFEERTRIEDIQFGDADGPIWRLTNRGESGTEGQDALISTRDGQTDRLFGRGGDDILVGGFGPDQMFGGRGDDLYLIGDNHGQDLIRDDGGRDVLVLAALRSEDSASTRQQGDDLIVTYGDQERIVIRDHFGSGRIEQIRYGAGGSLVLPIEPGGNGGDNGGNGQNGIGNDKANTLTGTSGDDMINARGDNDTVFAGAGDDLVMGGFGDDNLFGQAGRDRLFGDAGRDNLDGGTGNDLLYGGDGSDGIEGGEDSDRLQGGEGDDRLNGGPGSDVLIGGEGSDTIFGATPDKRLDRDGDVILGGPGADSLFGTAGDDRITGGLGNDYMEGGPGSDTYIFAAGDSPLLRRRQEEVLQDRTDSLSPAERDRILILGDGRPGEGVYLDGLGNNLNIRYGGGDRLLVPNAFKDRTAAIEEIQFGNADGPVYRLSDDGFSGTSESDALISTLDNRLDRLFGRGGDDILVGGFGRDEMIGGSGNDLYLIGDNHGQDVISDESGRDTVVLAALQSDMSVRFGRRGNDLILTYGTQGGQITIDDHFTDGRVEEIRFGAGGSLSIPASFRPTNGNDALLGQEKASETLRGLGGDDILYGSGFDDRMEGGTGNDKYVISSFDATDTIVDIAGREDVIQFTDRTAVSPLYIKAEEKDVTILYKSNFYGIDQVIIKDQLVQRPSAIEFIELPSFGGQSMTRYDIRSIRVGDDANNVRLGGNGNDLVKTRDGQDILQGGAGNDRLEGGRGSDFYLFQIGDGADRIVEAPGQFDSRDRISLFDVYNRNDVDLDRDGDDLVIEYGRNDRIVVEDHFAIGEENRSIDVITIGTGFGIDLERGLDAWRFYG